MLRHYPASVRPDTGTSALGAQDLSLPGGVTLALAMTHAVVAPIGANAPPAISPGASGEIKQRLTDEVRRHPGVELCMNLDTHDHPPDEN